MLSVVCLGLFISTVPAVQRSLLPQSGLVDVPWAKGGFPVAGEYALMWDDTLDGKVSESDKVCRIRIKLNGAKVIGEFVGPIMGEYRKAKIEGRVAVAASPIGLFTFRQIESGYSCAYQMTVGTGAFIGVWHDTKGRRGDFLLNRTGE
jgi:hypothetical protein